MSARDRVIAALEQMAADLKHLETEGALAARRLRGSYDDVVALQRPYAAEQMTVRGPVFPTRQPANSIS